MKFDRLLTKDAEPAGALAPRVKDFSLQIEAKDVSDDGEFEGYASVWGVVDQGGDEVQAGAFIESLKRAQEAGRLIPMLWQHDRREPIGIWTEIVEDAKGLRVKGRLLIDSDPLARRAHALLKAGAIGGMSIGYRIPVGGAEEDESRPGVWILKKLDLVEISLVTLPMLTEAKVTRVKNILEAGALPTVREFEGFLRDAGFPREKAVAIASASKSHLRGDPEGDEKAAGDERLERFDAAIANLFGKKE